MLTLGFLLTVIGIAVFLWRRRRHIRSLAIRGYWMVAPFLLIGLLFHVRRSPVALLGCGLIFVGLAIRHGSGLRRIGQFLVQLAAAVCRSLLVVIQAAIRLRLHVLLAMAGAAWFAYYLWNSYSDQIPTLDFDGPLSLRLGMGVVGFALGYAAGLQLQFAERSSPVLLGLASAVVFFYVARWLVGLSLSLIILAAFALIVIYRWQTVHAAVLTFAESAGLQFRRRPPDFAKSLDGLQQEHNYRLAAIRRLNLGEAHAARLIEEEQHRYLRALNSATGSEHDLGHDSHEADVGDWFDPPEGTAL